MKKIIWVTVFSLILLFAFLFSEFLILNVEVLSMDAYIVEKEIGFNLDSDKIHFGNVPMFSNGAYREIMITNIYDEDVKIFLSDSGKIDEYVYFEIDGSYYEKNNFILGENETKTFKVVFDNDDLPLGYYDGEIKIVVRKFFKFS